MPVVRIDGRIKRLYSIHQKLKRQKIDLDQVYDFVALRVITASASRTATRRSASSTRCGRRFPGRIKDFIAMPQPNGYQSLHTSVISEHGLALRGADPHRRDAPHRRGGHRGALEIQGRPRRRPSATSATSSGCGSCSNGSRRCATRTSSSRPEDRSLPGGGLHLHARRARSRRCRAARRRSTSPTPSTPTSAITASARA